MPFTIFLATDHAGFHHKNEIKAWLESEGFAVEDCGAYKHDPLDDYPDFISAAARAVSVEPLTTRAIIFGGSGQGEAMLANRYRNVRATVYYGGNRDIIRLSREHNDANILSLGANFVNVDECKAVIWDWLHTNPLPNEKYQRRINKVKGLSRKLYEVLSQEI